MSHNLVERLGSEPTRGKVVEDCVTLIEHHVKSKGLMVRTAFGTIKAVKKRFVPEVVNALLDDWLGKIQPHYDKWSAAGGAPGATAQGRAPTGGEHVGSFAEYLVARSDDVAEDLLAVTDARAERTSHTTAKKLYVKMRPSARSNVVEAIPELGRLIERYAAVGTAT